MKIIKASIKHISKLAKLQKAYMEYHKKIESYFAFKKNISTLWKQYAKQIIQDRNQIIFLALINEEIVGYMSARIEQKPPIYNITKVGIIGDSFVMPRYRRRGIFKKLTKSILDWMKKKNIQYVEHPVAAKNKLGKKAWKNRGFEEYMIFLKRKI